MDGDMADEVVDRRGEFWDSFGKTMAGAVPVAVDFGIWGLSVVGGVVSGATFFEFEAAVGLPEVVFEGVGVGEVFVAGVCVSGGFPHAAEVDVMSRVGGVAAGTDAFDDEFVLDPVDDLGRGAFEDEGDVFDEFGGWEETGRVGGGWIGVLEEARLVGVPEGDLGDFAVFVLFEDAFQPDV